jgi:2-keto-4-pentenoate hydratase/2-oxohepta-3-ene-1,7-dioic acid hydratase in catechol pathway
VTIRRLWHERFGIDAPRKIACVGLNYVDHAAEGGRDAPDAPILFAKFSTALIGPGESIVLPREETHVDSEAELAVVIGDAMQDGDTVEVEIERIGVLANPVVAER